DASDLAIGGKPVSAGEDVFPFRAQWVSAAEFIYTADGRIKRRRLDGETPTVAAFSATFSLSRPTYARKRRDFDSRTPRRVLGIVRPVVSPDGTQVAFVALGDIWILS